MANKDSFDAFFSILRDKINGFADDNQPNIKNIKNELRDKFDDIAKSQGYVSNEEYEALKGLAKRLEKRVAKLEELLEKPETNSIKHILNGYANFFFGAVRTKALGRHSVNSIVGIINKHFVPFSLSCLPLAFVTHHWGACNTGIMTGSASTGIN